MKILSTIALFAALAGGRAYAACTYPMPPDHIPDGNTATLQQMLAGQSAFQVYNEEIKAYTDCVKLEHDQALENVDPTKMTADQKQAFDKQKAELDDVMIKRVNAAVDTATDWTNRFNEQVRAFKAKHQSKS